MATKLGGIVIYVGGGLLIIKSFKALMMQSCKVMCQTKISSMVTYLHVFLPIKLH